MSISVSIVEDVRDTRENLAELLKGAGFDCLGTYPNGESALQGIPHNEPNVALVDIGLPGMSGIECVAKLTERLPELSILMLTMYEESELIFNSLRAGARGYILKNVPPDELFQAIEMVQAGGAPMTMQVARKVVEYFSQIKKPASDMEKLSVRENEVITLLAKGCLVKEIADQLGISAGTVRTHLKRIYEKLHVHSRTEAAVLFSSRAGVRRNA